MQTMTWIEETITNPDGTTEQWAYPRHVTLGAYMDVKLSPFGRIGWPARKGRKGRRG